MREWRRWRVVPAVRWAGWATGASRGLLGKPCCVRGGALRGGVCRLVAALERAH